MRARIAAALTTFGLVGCIGVGVPDWAMHVQPARVNVSPDANQIAERLVRELAYPMPAHGHLAPEEIALVGIREIGEGRLADAGLWISLADYRYHQEARQARVMGFGGAENLPANINHKVYLELVVAEVRRFNGLDFDDEIDAINGRLRGEDDVETALQQQLLQLGKTSAIDREAMRDALSQMRPPSDPAGGVSRYPALVEAFRRRLLQDFTRKIDGWSASYYLARTPIAALQKEAILVAKKVFEPLVCRDVADAFPLHRPATIAALTHSRPEVRANAAATLGMAPAEQTRVALEARLPVESDEQVKLALAYALFRHGVSQHLATLTAALAACKPATCALPAALIDWLPTAAKVELDQAPIARIVADTSIAIGARRFAAAILRDIGREKPLDPASIEALVSACHTKANNEEILPELAFEAVGAAEGLSRADVVARLQTRETTPAARKYVLYPAPLLARLAEVSTADDLPLLQQMMSRFGERGGPEAHFVVAAALNIPGEPPHAHLGNWFLRYPALQAHIGVGLASREAFPRDKLARLVERGDARTEIMVKTVTRAPDANSVLLGYLQNGSLDEKFQAARLAGLPGHKGSAGSLYPLLRFQDARYYPDDALLRHAAASSLLRIALANSKPR